MGYDEELVISQAQAGLCVEILYKSKGDEEATWRVVEPYSHRDVKISRKVWRTFLLAWDVEKDDHIRSYNINKIQDIKASEVPSQNRFEFEI